jgi:hypothetical protein
MSLSKNSSFSSTERPLGISIIAGLQMIGGAILTLVGVSYFTIWRDFSIFFPFFLFYLIFGIFSFIIGWGLWEGKRWAWIIYVIVVALGILVSLLTIDLVSLIFAGLILWYMFQPHVKRYFRIEAEPSSSYTPSSYSTTPSGFSYSTPIATPQYAVINVEDLKSELKKYEEYLQRLELLKNEGKISDTVYAQLRTEYTQKIDEIKKRLLL